MKVNLSGRKGEDALHWKGLSTSYPAKHTWLTKNYGKPEKCTNCGIRGSYSGKIRKVWNIQWANISKKYLREVTDYIPLCIKCHAKYDATSHCKKGHERTIENTYTIGNRRACRICQQEYSRNYYNKKKSL